MVKKYYNHCNKHFGHWSNTKNRDEVAKKCNPRNRKIYTEEELAARGKKISEAKAKRKAERIEAGLPARQKNSYKVERGPQSEESNKKRSEAMKKAWKEGRNTGTTGIKCVWSDERRENHAKGCANANHIMTDEIRKNISEGSKAAWASGKMVNRKSNNMKDFIWVRMKEDNRRTRIHKDKFDENLHVRGRLNNE